MTRFQDAGMAVSYIMVAQLSFWESCSSGSVVFCYQEPFLPRLSIPTLMIEEPQ